MILRTVLAPIVRDMRLLVGVVILLASFLVSPVSQAAEEIRFPDGWVLCTGAGCPDNRMSSVSVGHANTCAVVDGAVFCWSATRVWRQPMAPARTVSVGFDHACAVLTSGKVACWGSNSRGQLNVADATGVKEVFAGHSTTCVITRNGAVKCVGWAIGDGWTDAKTLTQMRVPKAKAFLSSAYAGVCVTTTEGVWCHSGQDDALDITNGYGPVVDPVACDPACGRVVFRPLTYGKTATGGSVGRYSGCLVGKSVSCWDSSKGVLEPRPAGVKGARSVGVTDDRGCIVAKGRLLCWVGSEGLKLEIDSSHPFRSVEVDWQVAALATDGDLWVMETGEDPVQWTFLNPSE